MISVQFIRGRQIWRGIYEATFRVGKSLRHHRELFRRIDGAWHSGEAYPIGTKSSPLRKACPEIAAGLDTIAKAKGQPIDLPTVDFTVHLRNTISRMVCMIEEIRTIQSPVNTLVDVQSLGRAALGNNPLPLKVVVEVSGGVAEVTTCPTGVEVEIVDHDNAKVGL